MTFGEVSRDEVGILDGVVIGMSVASDPTLFAEEAIK